MTIEKDWQKKSLQNQKKFDQFLKSCKERETINKLDEVHEQVFSEINCLDCANCCKNHSPTFKTTDIKRISKVLKLKESVFIDKYLKIDDENDYVLKQSPCPFLQKDNACFIYDVRPSDCSRYPYTNEDVLIKRKKLTLKNSLVCPAVYKVLTILEKTK